MRSEELGALAELVAGAATGVADQSRDVHAAIADCVFQALSLVGIPATPVRRVHDAVALRSHRASRAVTGVAARSGGVALATLATSRPGSRPGSRPASRTASAEPLGAAPRGRVALGALAGAWGDRLAAASSPLRTDFALLVDDARPPTGALAVFLHGLGETELAWRRPGYGEALADRHGLTPVYARYNSGAALSDSGAALADGLARLLDGWPVAVRELTLVGHSLGGLVIRAACHQAGTAHWAGRVRRTVALGAPHAGAPLARAVAVAERALGALPETRPFAAPLRVRSAAIRELAHGLDIPFLPGADHYFVSASVTRDPQALAGRALGDLLVHRRSAWAQRTRTERLCFDDGHYRHIGGATHFALLGHPAVGELLCEWVSASPRPALVAPAD